MKFVKEIIKDIPKDEIWTKRWADYVNKYVPDFPNGDDIFEGDKLLHAVTSYLFIVTVGHSIDHFMFGSLDKREIPMRIRQKSPDRNTKMIKRSKLCSPTDLMKLYMADRLFYKPTTITSLIKTKYKFKTAEQSLAVEAFKADLRSAEQELLTMGIKYMPLKDIAASIQF